MMDLDKSPLPEQSDEKGSASPMPLVNAAFEQLPDEIIEQYVAF